MSKHPPECEIYDHSNGPAAVIRWIEERITATLGVILAVPGADEEVILDQLETVEISLVSDEAIAAVHGEFMDDPTPTDVITFHHGEILVSSETAMREACAHGHTHEEELLLYIVHGLLHLNGYDDLTPSARDRMHRRQDEILRQLITGG
jgi:probable rRNA maturation factor